MEKKAVTQIEVDEIIKSGLLSVKEAKQFHKTLRGAIFEANGSDSEPREIWGRIVDKRILKPWHPHALHQLVYYSVYANWDSSVHGPPLYWFPSLDQSKRTNLGRVMEIYGPKFLGAAYKDPISSFRLFREFSVQHPEEYWEIFLKELSIVFHEAPKCILDSTNKSKPGGTWLPGAVLNIAECCLQPAHHRGKTDDSVAVVWRDEFDESNLNHMTLRQLREQVMLVANALDATFTKGDAIAI